MHRMRSVSLIKEEREALEYEAKKYWKEQK